MSQNADDNNETRITHKHLGEAATLVGFSLAGWLILIPCFALAYGWIAWSPLGSRVSISVALIGLAVPATVLLIREQTALSPGALLAAVIRSRALRAGMLLPTQISPLADTTPTRDQRREARAAGRALPTGTGAVALTEPLPPPEGIDLDTWFDDDGNLLEEDDA